MRPCDITDLPRLNTILTDHYGSSCLGKIRSDLLGNSTYWFLNKDCCMCFDSTGEYMYVMHIYSMSRDTRGLELKKWAIACARWVLDNTNCQSLLNFVRKDHKELRMLMASIGSKKMGIIPGTNEILYVSTGDMGIEE